MSSAYLRLLIFLPAILIPTCVSPSPAFLMMYSAYKLNKQGDNIQPWHTPFPIWNQSFVPCPVPGLPDLHIGFSRGRSGGLVFPSLSEFSTVYYGPHTLLFICFPCVTTCCSWWVFHLWWSIYFLGFPCGSDGKESACNSGDPGPISGSGRSHGEGNDYPLQCSCLENSMDRGVWWLHPWSHKELDITEWL